MMGLIVYVVVVAVFVYVFLCLRAVAGLLVDVQCFHHHSLPLCLKIFTQSRHEPFHRPREAQS